MLCDAGGCAQSLHGLQVPVASLPDGIKDQVVQALGLRFSLAPRTIQPEVLAQAVVAVGEYGACPVVKAADVLEPGGANGAFGLVGGVVGDLGKDLVADLVLFDEQTVKPRLPTVEHDLPSGARRLVQKADGIEMTIVNGQVALEKGESTGANAGQLLRGPLAS